MQYWFCSDLHLGHFRIINYCGRPFKSLEEMDSTLIKNWNSKVKPEDIVFYLGDFCLSRSSMAPEAPRKAFEHYRSQLNGEIILIAGNHDNRGSNQARTIIENMVIRHGGEKINLVHDPKYASSNYKFNFTGHCHGTFGKFRFLTPKSVIVDLSCENWDYQPVDINTILSEYTRWNKGKK